MTRWLLTISLFLAFGAALNIGFAYATGWLSKPRIESDATLLQKDVGNAVIQDLYRRIEDQMRSTPVIIMTEDPPRPKQPPAMIVRKFEQASSRRLYSCRVILGPGSGLLLCRIETQFGWPSQCFECVSELGAVPGAVTPWTFAPDLRTPHLSRFALNTAFYAGILGLVSAMIVVGRRSIRLARNLCPNCSYPIGGSDRCTECGTTLKQGR